MAESRWLSRMPVYDIAKGRVVGRIHRLILDAEARKVVGLLLATRLGREPRCLPFRHVHAIGEHAVTVRGTEAIAPLSELPDMEEALRAQRRIHNSPILTEGGAFIGDVDEFTINTQTGRLEAMLVSGGLIRDLFRGQAALPSHLIVAIGEDATIVKDLAVSFLAQHQREQKQEAAPHRLRPASATHDKSADAEERENGAGAGVSWADRLKRALTLDGRIADKLRLEKGRAAETTVTWRPEDSPPSSPTDAAPAERPVGVQGRPTIHIIRADERSGGDSHNVSGRKHIPDTMDAGQEDTFQAGDASDGTDTAEGETSETNDAGSGRS